MDNINIRSSLSVAKTTQKHISITDLESNPQMKDKVNSPRSIEAMKYLGYTLNDLLYFSFKEFKIQHPELIGQNKESLRNRYEYAENLRMERIKEIKAMVDKPKSNECDNHTNTNNNPQQLLSLKRNKSQRAISVGSKGSKYDNRTHYHEKSNLGYDINLSNMVQNELMKELTKKKIENKIRCYNERRNLFMETIEDKKKKKDIASREIKVTHKKEYQMKNEPYMHDNKNEAELEATEKIIRQQQQLRNLTIKNHQNEHKREEVHMNHQSIIENSKKRRYEKYTLSQEKSNQRRKEIENFKLERKMEYKERDNFKREKVEDSLKRLSEQCKEFKKEYFITKSIKEEKYYNYSKKLYEKQKIKEDELMRKTEDNKRIREMLENEVKKKADEYNEKKRDIENRQRKYEYKKQYDNESKSQQKRDNEERVKSALQEIEKKERAFKEKIEYNLKAKENDVYELQREREYIIQKIREQNQMKIMEINDRLRNIANEKKKKIVSLINSMREKDKKLEEIEFEKMIDNKYKQEIDRHLYKKKTDYYNQIAIVFHQEKLNENTFKTIKEMFPNHSHINYLINSLKKSDEGYKNRKNQGSSLFLGIETSSYHNKSLGNITTSRKLDSEMVMQKRIRPSSSTQSILRGNNAIKSKNYYQFFHKKNYTPTSSTSNPVIKNPSTPNTRYSSNKEISYNSSNNNNSKALKLTDYRLILNKELLNLLLEEKQKEALRERQLEELSHCPVKQKQLEIKLEKESKQAIELIYAKNK